MPTGTLIAVISIVLYLGIALAILVNHHENGSKLLWLTLFLVFPIVGFLAYCLFGIGYRRPSVRKRLHQKSLDLFHSQMPPETAEALFSDKDMDKVDIRCRPLARLLRAAGEGNKVYSGSSFEIITSGQRKRELLLEDIRAAKKFIHIEYFRFGNDKSGREVRDLLIQKVKEGVEVRFLNNNMIGRKIPRSYFRNMRKEGIDVLPFTHIHNGFRSWLMRLNHQNHRKIVVIDGQISYTGGMNLNDNYFYKWRDTHLRLCGPVVARLQASFIDHWISSGGSLKHDLSYYFPPMIPQLGGNFKDKLIQVVTDAPENPWTSMQLGYEWILHNAREYVYIQTPYFIPPDSFLDALKVAALRGVDVRIMLPKDVDTPLAGPANHSFYEECLEAGIRIFERGGEFIHSKTLVADDSISIIGASNLDVRSFSINSEVNTVIYDHEVAISCKEIFLSDDALLQEIDADTWIASRKWYQDALSQFMRMFGWLL